MTTIEEITTKKLMELNVKLNYEITDLKNILKSYRNSNDKLLHLINELRIKYHCEETLIRKINEVVIDMLNYNYLAYQ